MTYTLKNEITVLYLFYRELSTRTLLNILRDHSRERDCHKSYLALCYTLRKRGISMTKRDTGFSSSWRDEVLRNKAILDRLY